MRVRVDKGRHQLWEDRLISVGGRGAGLSVRPARSSGRACLWQARKLTGRL